MPAGRCSLASTLPKCLVLLFVVGKQLRGDATLSCPLLPLLVRALRGLFIRVIDDRDLSVLPLLEFTVLPHAGEERGWETWWCFFPVCLPALGGMEEPSGYLPPFLETKGDEGNGGNPLISLWFLRHKSFSLRANPFFFSPLFPPRGIRAQEIPRKIICQGLDWSKTYIKGPISFFFKGKKKIPLWAQNELAIHLPTVR